MAAEPEQDMKDLERRYDERYQRYGKSLEAEHTGEFLAISPSGETILSSSRAEVAHRAAAKFGHGVFLYRVGHRAVGKWL